MRLPLCSLTDKCVERCVNGFHSKSLNGAEKACIEKCVDKNVKLLQRVKMRFEEQTLQQMQQSADQTK